MISRFIMLSLVGAVRRRQRPGVAGVGTMVGLALLAMLASPAWGDPAGLAAAPDVGQAYFSVRLGDLNLTEGKWPDDPPPQSALTASDDLTPRVEVEGGEGYLLWPALDVWHGSWQYRWTRVDARRQIELTAHAAADQDVVGTIWAPDAAWEKLTPVRFRIPRERARLEAKAPFHRARLTHYTLLQDRAAPGAAWFRYQADKSRQALNAGAGRDAQWARPVNQWSSPDNTMDLFTGGRALSENLQLDRVIPPARDHEAPSVPIDSVAGVTVREMDWAPLIAGKKPALDPLASRIPIDQHAVFFPSFQAMVDLLDEVDASGVPALQMIEPRSEDSGVKQRYQKQLCLSLTGMGRLLGPRVIDSIAVTGSDAYLRVGSDVAVLFEAKDPATLLNLLRAQVALGRQREPDAKPTEGSIGRLSYFGARSADRSICCYVARLGESNVVVVANSPAQLLRLSETLDANRRSIADAPEYTFFRDRYPRTDKGESAFVVLTDATIRRWCGPRWRIADSRRTLAAAVLAELQAEHLDELVGRAPADAAAPVALSTDRYVPDMGMLALNASGAASDAYGSLDYMTPIVELSLDRVTPSEASMYGRWRDGYQRNWSNYFDPIALRLSAARGKLSADMTVMPLIAQTEYKTLIDLTSGVKLSKQAADPHEAILQAAIALNPDSEPVKQAAGFAKQVVPGVKVDPLGWLGESMSIYLDDDPVWAEAAKAPSREKFFQDNIHRLPIAVYVESNSPLKLAAFMTALRLYIDRTAPNITKWEPREHAGINYMQVSSKGTGLEQLDKVNVYYATLPDALIVSLNQGVLERALDRHAVRHAQVGAADAGGKDGQVEAAQAPRNPTTRPAKEAAPWLGDSAAMRGNDVGLDVSCNSLGGSYRQRMQHLAWANLPILNEWKRLYPKEDPVALHERLWQVRLVDPAGGAYVWNEKFHTMESTLFGHPAAPKPAPALPPALRNITGVALGLTFENHGLRARAEIERKAR